MTKSRSIEDRLAELKALGKQGKSDAAVTAVRESIRDKNSLIVARGANIAAELKIESAETELVSAFDRFMVDPEKTDKGCSAKTAIVRALDVIEAHRDAIYLAGVKHVQHEPTWGGQSDTAGELRAASAFALVNMNYRGAMLEIIPLLFDTDASARLAGVRAVASLGREEAEAMLRLKALSGDAEPGVVAECFLGLMRERPERSAPFVEKFFDRDDLRDVAAMALGESRKIEALPVLKRLWDNSLTDNGRELALSSIALLRLEEGLDYILSIIEGEHARTAALAIKCLRLYRGDEKVKARVMEIAKERDEPAITAAAREIFS